MHTNDHGLNIGKKFIDNKLSRAKIWQRKLDFFPNSSRKHCHSNKYKFVFDLFNEPIFAEDNQQATDYVFQINQLVVS